MTTVTIRTGKVDYFFSRAREAALKADGASRLRRR